MGLDKLICGLPVVGTAYKRMYRYFRKHLTYTDGIHISLGLGIGLLIFRENWGWLFLVIGLLGHVYAFIQGGE